MSMRSQSLDAILHPSTDSDFTKQDGMGFQCRLPALLGQLAGSSSYSSSVVPTERSARLSSTHRFASSSIDEEYP